MFGAAKSSETIGPFQAIDSIDGSDLKASTGKKSTKSASSRQHQKSAPEINRRLPQQGIDDLEFEAKSSRKRRKTSGKKLTAVETNCGLSDLNDTEEQTRSNLVQRVFWNVNSSGNTVYASDNATDRPDVDLEMSDVSSDAGFEASKGQMGPLPQNFEEDMLDEVQNLGSNIMNDEAIDFFGFNVDEDITLSHESPVDNYLHGRPAENVKRCPGQNPFEIYDDDNNIERRCELIRPTSGPKHSDDALRDISLNTVTKKTKPRVTQELHEVHDDPQLGKTFIQTEKKTSSADQYRAVQTHVPAPPVPRLLYLPPKVYRPNMPISPSADLVPRAKRSQPLTPPENALAPFVRPPFPRAVGEHSPVIGLTGKTVLRTCFRIGEAVNAAVSASRAKQDAIIELYARVLSSERDRGVGCKQRFEFADLFTDKPPHLNGTYTLWKGVQLWDFDSAAFLGENGKGKMCRVVGRIHQKEETGAAGLQMVILNIWGATWEDVEVVKGVVCSKDETLCAE